MSAPSRSEQKPLLATGRTSRVALAVLAPLGPLAMAGWALATPYDPAADIPAAAAALAADPVGTQWGLLLLIVAGILGALGSLVVAAVIRPSAPRLGAIGGALAFVGFIVAAYPGAVAAVAASADAGLDRNEVLALVTAIDAQAQGVLAAVLFVTLPAGILILGIAALLAWRRGSYGLTSAIVLAAAIPLVLVGGFIHGATLALGWIVVAVGYGLAAARYPGVTAS